MSENQAPTPQRALEIVAGKLAELGPDFLLGLDLKRIWATGAQAFPGDDFTLVIFRDQMLSPGQDGEPHLSIKNVAAIVVPTNTAREFSANLAAAFAQMDSQENGGE